jgi:hypothetical protein
MPTVGLLVLALGACTAYKSLIGENTVSLQGADVLSMQADIRRPVKKICPREPVQMWVRVEAKLEDQNSPARLETWVGDRQARRNGFLDFGNFVFASGQGRSTGSASARAGSVADRFRNLPGIRPL